MKSVDQLESKLAAVSPELVADLAKLDGDIMILGAGGKMGPSLAKLAKNAVDQGGLDKRVVAVSRFSSGGLRQELEAWGVETLAADLMNESDIKALPKLANVVYMAGQKFGTTGREYYTWAMNTLVPAKVADHLRASRIVVFSSGNVYPFMPVAAGGAAERVVPDPVGEYAQSCLGRERIFQYFSHTYGTPIVLFRLNYAIDLRYGVLLDLAQQIYRQEAVDVSMGHVNVIWQGDANEYALRSLRLAEPEGGRVLNATGPETISIRWLAGEFAEHFAVDPILIGDEQATCLLNNASAAHALFGYPKVSLQQMIAWTAAWIEAGGATLDKPTHFQERKGRY